MKIDKNVGGKPCNPTLYRAIIGGLAYAMTSTRPDIAYAVSKLSRYCNCATQLHLVAAKRVLQYLKGTREYGLVYRKVNDLRLTAYIDADYACCLYGY